MRFIHDPRVPPAEVMGSHMGASPKIALKKLESLNREHHMEIQNVARAGLSVALLAVSAWVSLPIGPVPFTLQTMVLALLPAVLDRRTACLTIAAYLLLGALGLPVFASFGGGIGTIAGPTGGFLWGFLFGIFAATTIVRMLPKAVPPLARVLAGDIAMILIAYACGTVQLMGVASLDLPGALAVAVLPFVIPDAVKVFVGASIGLAASKALGRVSVAR